MNKSDKSTIIKDGILITAAVTMILSSALLLIRVAAAGFASWPLIAAAAFLMLIMAGLVVCAIKNKRLRVLMTVIMLLLGIAAIIGNIALSRINSTINQISVSGKNKSEITQISAVVLKEDKAESLKDVDGYDIGYLDDKGSAEMLAEIKSATGSNQSIKKQDNSKELVDALLDQTIGLAVINNAYIDIISEQEDYKDFTDRIRILKTIEIEDKIESSQDISKRDKFLVYVSGIDTYGSVNTRSRSDVNILVAVNKETGDIQMVNTPRDAFVTLGGGINQKDKLTHAGVFGIACSIETLENLYGVDIDYYLRMNFSGFEQIIDSIGGIDVYSDEDFTVEPVRHYTVGINHLNGEEALAFARERHSFSEGDVKRGKHQMAVIKATIEKLSSREALMNYRNVLDDISDSFETDIPTEGLYAIAAQQLKKNTKWNVETYTVTGKGTYAHGYAMPDWNLYMMELDEASVQEARDLIKQTLGR